MRSFLCFLALFFFVISCYAQDFTKLWEEVKRLQSEQKYSDALKEAEKIYQKAVQEENQQEWLKSLLRVVALKRGLHSYGQAVRFMLEEKWPTATTQKALVHLFYATTLMDYYHNYSWEINQREKVSSQKEVDLKKWTAFDIFEEMNLQYLKAYEYREELGKLYVHEYPEYLERNSYPKEVASTLRDFLSHQWANFLGNTSTWRPYELKEKYQIDFESVAKAPESRKAVSSEDLGKLSVHPVLRMVFILDDLYRWNMENKRFESALESQIMRVQKIAAIFDRKEQRAFLKESFVELLSQFRDYPWWAAGQAEYASLWQKDGDLIQARELALEGHKLYPESLGGRKCLYMAKSIEMPDFPMRAMGVDRTKANSLEIEHKNMKKLYLRAYKVSFDEWMNRKYRYLGSVHVDDLREYMSKNMPSISWDVDLADPGDYKHHKTYLVPKIKEKGFYMIAASVEEDFRNYEAKTSTCYPNKILATYMTITDMVVLSQPVGQDWEVFVVDGRSGKPLPNIHLTLYRYDYNKGPINVRTFATDKNGYVLVKQQRNSESCFLVARKGYEVSFDANSFYFGYHSDNNYQQGCFVYTDRSIYRPLQKVYYKVVAYRGNSQEANYRVLANREGEVTFYDPNYKVIEVQKVKTNKYGTAAGEFAIPKGRVLGQYRLNARISGAYGQGYIRVEEYKRPTFEVTLKKPERAMRLNESVSIQGEARYYFGLPVSTGKIFYRVTRETVWPWWYWWFYRSQEDRHTYEVAAGNASLDKDGTFTIPFIPKADPSLSQDISYTFKVDVEITDEGGETRNASNTYPIGFVAIQAELQMPYNYFVPEEDIEISVLRKDLSNVPKAGKGEYRLVKLLQPKQVMTPNRYPMNSSFGKFSIPGDKMRPRWESDKTLEQYLYSFKDDAKLSEGTLEHAQDGKSLVKLNKLSAGAYRLYYKTQDDWGTVYETRKEFLVAGKDFKLMIPFFLLVKSNHVSAGEKAEIFFGTGQSGQSYCYEVYQANRLISREWINHSQNRLFSHLVTEKDRGGFSVRIFGVMDYNSYNQTENIYVPWDNKNLQISFESFRNLLFPGQKETWTVSIKGPNSESVAAEVLAYMYDRSLDFFTAHNYPSPSSLFGSKIGTPYLRSNISLAYFSHIYEHQWHVLPGYVSWGQDRFIAFDGYPIGGLGHREYYRTGNSFPVMSLSATKSKKNGMRAEAPMAEAKVAADVAQEPAPEKAKEEQQPVALRTNFNETAFFQPQLVTDKEGKVKIEFQVPDSVTSWNFYVHAITKDLSFMTKQAEVVTRKDLMVRPYMPRFFREADEAILKVVVNNASEKEMQGNVTLSVFDPETQEDKTKDFGLTTLEQTWKADAKGSANLSWSLKAPHRIGVYAFKVVAKSESYQDGELRPLPVLPGRMHLVQSKFVTLRENQTRSLYLKDLEEASNDPSLVHQSLVVNVDAQLVYSVLKALPYLSDYPYECVEQTFNRFFATGILSSVYKEYPAIAKMAKEFSKRETQYQSWNQDDANRKMTLEETPWLQVAQGGEKDMSKLINVLDERIANAKRDDALDKLRKAQIGDGSFPWWAGGPPSPYMTLYLVHGFAKMQEFQVEIPKDMINNAWKYLASYFREYYSKKFLQENYGSEFIAFLNYTLSCYKDPSYYEGSFTEEERKQMLEYSFKHWKSMSPYIKAYLSLTLMRSDRPQDARLVLESIMDSSITKEDQGTFWAPEDRGWLWYNDNIESHAFVLRVLQEVKPEQKDQVDGLVLWLLLNKKCNQWKSTKATAEVLYSLLYTLRKQNALGVQEKAQVSWGQKQYEMVFEPDSYTGANKQIVIPSQEIMPKEMATAQVTKHGPGYMFASMTWHYSTEKMPQEARGDFLSVTRSYFLRKHEGKEYILVPMEEGTKVEVGDQVEVHLSIRSKHPMEYVHLRDPRGAGFEPETNKSGHRWDLGICWYEEVRDSASNFFFEHLPQGEYTFKYRIRANMAGQFRVGPATLQGMYAPEFAAFSSGAILNVK